jgi:ADP-ribose pyrophosphatase YjhB (NUDIX family)
MCPECGFVQFYDPKVAVIALATWQDRVLLIRRGVEPMKGMWALPGGYMDAGEMPADALARELVEEVGLDVRIVRLLDVYPMAGAGPVPVGIVLAYHCEVDGALPPSLVCQDDVTEAGWFQAAELPGDVAFASTQTLLAAWRDRANGD